MHSGVDQCSLVKVYTTCLRHAVLEYGCQIWNYNSPDYLKEEIERIQRRALRIICPHLSYNKALITNNIPLLSQRRNDLCKSHFKKLLNPKHKLNEHIPQRRKDLRSYSLRIMTNTLIRHIVRPPDFIRTSSLQVLWSLTILCDHLFL